MLDDVNIVQSTEVPFEEAVPADDLMHFHLQFIVFCQSPPTKNFCHPPSPVGGRIPRKKVCASKKRKGKEHKRFTQKWTAFGVFPKKLRVFVSVLRYKNRCPGKKGSGGILSDEHEAEWCSKCSSPFSLSVQCAVQQPSYSIQRLHVPFDPKKTGTVPAAAAKANDTKKEEEEQRLDQATKFDASREREEEKVNGGEKKAPFSE